MAYRIAVASSDGVNINQSFGEASEFTIVEVTDSSNFTVIEKREAISAGTPSTQQCSGHGADREKECKSGCNTGGCAGGEGEIGKVSLVSDCRCIICKRIGFQALKQLEKRAITGFDVECTIEEALRKVVYYFDRVDNHSSLRGIAH